MKSLQHKFVEFIPNEVEEGILYISISYSTAIHKCVCGCGNEVVTPLTPLDWELTFNGETVSLYPSIGNWEFECKSHYWIVKDKVRLASTWPKERIRYKQKQEANERDRYYKKKKTTLRLPY